MVRSKALKSAYVLVFLMFSIGSAELKPSFYLGWSNGPSRLYYHNKSDDQSLMIQNINSYTHYAWELYAGTHLTNHFGIQSGALFNRSETSVNRTGVGAYSGFAYSMKYVNVPLLLTLTTQHDDKNGYVSFAAGPMFCILRDAERTDGAEQLYKLYGYELKDKYHTVTVDLLTQAEIKIRIMAFLLNLGIRYQQGFADIENKAFTDNQGNKVWNSTTLIDPSNYAPRATTIRNGWGVILGIEFAL